MPQSRVRNVLVTGASGFVGSALCGCLVERGYRVTRALRSADQVQTDSPIESTDLVVGDIAAGTVWEGRLESVDAVVHLAARTHVMDDAVADATPDSSATVILSVLAKDPASDAGARSFASPLRMTTGGEA